MPVVTGISVSVPDGNTRDRETTATIILTGENLPTDDASELLAGLDVAVWKKRNGWNSSWTTDVSGITMRQESVTLSETQYTITYTVKVSRGNRYDYRTSGCLKVEAAYGSLKEKDTFCFGS